MGSWNPRPRCDHRHCFQTACLAIASRAASTARRRVCKSELRNIIFRTSFALVTQQRSLSANGERERVMESLFPFSIQRLRLAAAPAGEQAYCSQAEHTDRTWFGDELQASRHVGIPGATGY